VGARLASRRCVVEYGDATIPETMAENLTECEWACLNHLGQAENLKVRFAEYCHSFRLNVNEWYGLKQPLVR
jgi:hypothetical protein